MNCRAAINLDFVAMITFRIVNGYQEWCNMYKSKGKYFEVVRSLFRATFEHSDGVNETLSPHLVIRDKENTQK